MPYTPDQWPQPAQWPSPGFLRELRDKGRAETVRLLTDPLPELEINEQSLQGYRLADLVIEFSGLSMHFDAYRLGYYYRVRYHIHGTPDPRQLPLYWYEVEYSPEGELLDDFFGHGLG